MQITGFHACESDPLQLWCLFLWIIVLRNDKGDKGQTFHSIGELPLSAVPRRKFGDDRSLFQSSMYLGICLAFLCLMIV